MYQAFTEDQIQIRDLVRDFTRKEITPVAHEYDEKNEHPKELITRMRKELGINGLTIPEEFGGMGYGSVEQCLITEEMSRGCLGIALCFGYTGLGQLPIMKGGWTPPIDK